MYVGWGQALDFRADDKRVCRVQESFLGSILLPARLYLVEHEYIGPAGTSIGTVRSGGSSLFSGLSGLSSPGTR